MEGQTVTTRGIVTGDFQENDANIRRNLGGFYVQDGAPDGDPHTSDGIFVFDGNEPAVDVNTGDIVVVTGTVTEYFGETQIAGQSSGRPDDKQRRRKTYCRSREPRRHVRRVLRHADSQRAA
jgi:predicted extracellular nuclease